MIFINVFQKNILKSIPFQWNKSFLNVECDAEADRIPRRILKFKRWIFSFKFRGFHTDRLEDDFHNFHKMITERGKITGIKLHLLYFHKENSI